jgi:hypothetical protein
MQRNCLWRRSDPQWSQPERMAHRQAIDDLALGSGLLGGTEATLPSSKSRHFRICTSGARVRARGLHGPPQHVHRVALRLEARDEVVLSLCAPFCRGRET